MEIQTSADLATYLKLNVPGFEKVSLLGPGNGYHYTTHLLKIQQTGRFLGITPSASLDQTQKTMGFSEPAVDEDGVVFAYEDLAKAKQEGVGQQIIQIAFRSAVSAMHAAEAKILEEHNKKRFAGFTFLIHPTLLILARDIT
jgi:hypothetical protein